MESETVAFSMVASRRYPMVVAPMRLGLVTEGTE